MFFQRIHGWIIAEWLVLLCSLALVSGLSADLYLSADLSLHVETAKRMLAGEILYNDIFEVNLPMSLYWVMPAIYIASLGDANVMYVLAGYNMFIGLCCILLSMRVLSYCETCFSQVGFRFATMCGLIYVVLLLPFGFSYNEFGQKSHIFTMLMLPYVFLFYVTQQRLVVGFWLRVAVGGLAAVGMCIKPYYVMIPLALLLYRLARDKRFSYVLCVENVVMLFFGSSYLASVWLFSPSYFSEVVPLAMIGHKYFTAGNAAAFQLQNIAYYAVPVVVMFIYSDKSELKKILLLCLFASIVQALIQHSNWGYILMPMMAFSVFLFVLMAYDTVVYIITDVLLVDGAVMSNRLGVPLIAGIVLLMLIAALPSSISKLYDRQSELENQDYLLEDGSVVLTSEFRPRFPRMSYVDIGVFDTWYPSLSLVKGFLSFEKVGVIKALSEQEQASVKGLEKTLRQKIMNDLRRSRPKKIYVPIHPDDDGLAYVEYLSRNLAFRAFWQAYSFDGLVGNKYRLYIRQKPVK
jgi:hypothetical protein